MNNKRVLIIAEAGVNHNGDINLAKKMIDCAIESEADIIKFQTGLPHNVISKYAPKAEYQKRNTGNADENQLEMARRIAFEYESFAELKDYCDDRRIEFLSTPFDIESMDYLYGIGMNKWKIPSGEITNLPYLEHIAFFKNPVIMSTGMSTLDEVRSAVEVLAKGGVQDITLLHCTTDYPTKYEDVNLNAMLTLRDELRLPVGYSDHTLGIEVALAAVAMGATVIEKHFTLDRTLPGPDNKASLEPDEFRAMVRSIRNIESAFGSGQKTPCSAELPNIIVARKSIVAKVNIRNGEEFTSDNLTTKRPGNGISAMRWYDIIGTKAKRDYSADELIEE